jgi:hypothetical protein
VVSVLFFSSFSTITIRFNFQVCKSILQIFGKHSLKKDLPSIETQKPGLQVWFIDNLAEISSFLIFHS